MFYNQRIEEIFMELGSGKNGLKSTEVKKRLENFGYNEIQKVQKFNSIKLLLSQFTDPIVLILIFATALSFSLGENIDGIVIVAILIINAILGFVQEYKAEKAIELLRKLSSPNVKVIRNGKKSIISSIELVPGDVVFLEAGDKICADIRLFETVVFSTNESTLTGESTIVNKSVEVLSDNLTIADQSNMVFAGTLAISGRATGIVVQTGMNSQLGKIAHLVQETKEKPTNLQKKLKKLGITLGVIIIIIVISIFLFGWIKGLDIFEMLFTALSLAVSAIPEGLPAVVTVVLALGVQKMYKKNALVRKLKSIETLGSITVICSDKTGTITMNQMTVTDIWINNKDIKIGSTKKNPFLYNGQKINTEEFQILMEIANNCNNAVWPNIGDPTELALLEVSKKAGIVEVKKRVGEVPFDPSKKFMITEHDDSAKDTSEDGIGSGTVKYLKGSAEIILGMCKYYHLYGEIVELNDVHKKEILKKNSNLASQALRVLGFAYKENKHDEFVFVGLMGMIDPPRPEVHDTLNICQKAGIRVIMITGDHKETAMAIAKQIGIYGDILEGKELDEIQDLNYIIDKVNIFARVNPEHKVRILECLQKKGEIVAMTGDGVNDAPALKNADVGISMSLKGTDVARDASDIILVDDNFSSIVSAIEYGRIMYDNIKKFVKLLLSANFDEILIISIAIFVGLPLPMLPIQILRINLMTDSLPAIALGMDPAEKNIMLRKPRSKKEHILTGSWGFIIISSIIGTIVSLLLFVGEDHIVGLDRARTMVITTAIIFEFFLAFTARSSTYNIWELKPNKFLIGSVVAAFVFHLIVVYTPLNHAFDFTFLTINDWLIIIAMGSSGFVFWEAWKLIRKLR